jgi:hypothetical protein
VNIEVVSLGRPDSRTTRTASATAALTLSPGVPAGAMLKAKSMWPHCPSRTGHRDPRRTVISENRGFIRYQMSIRPPALPGS